MWNVECGTAVRARYSHKVAPIGVEMVECETWNVERQLGHDTLAKLHLSVSRWWNVECGTWNSGEGTILSQSCTCRCRKAAQARRNIILVVF